MSVMSDIAAEIVMYWEEYPDHYERQLPNGSTVAVYKDGGVIAGGYTKYKSLPEAFTAVGAIAREQLAQEALKWT